MAPRWQHLQSIQTRLAEERGTLFKDAPLRVALCYPSPYHVGMSSLGFQTIYREICRHPGAAAERAFLPDDPDDFRKGGMPLVTYESQRPVSEHAALAISIAYELEITGVFELLSLSGLPPLASQRDGRHPIVVAGGPLTFSNPRPLEPFVDVLLLGEGEEAIHALIDALQSSPDREALFDALEGLPGVHLPSRCQPGTPLPPIARVPVERLPACSQIVTPNTELRSLFLVEAERGCSRSCAYCVMRRTTNGGMRPVPVERVLEKIPPDAERVGLVGAAVTDHPHIAQLLRAIVDSGRGLGVSSLRACRITDEVAQLLAKGGYRTLTIASDGASQRLRDRVERHTTEQHLVTALERAKAAGFMRAKLYEMIGLPSEGDADIDELARFTRELSKILPLSLGVAPFVAKRNTPLDGAPFESMACLEARLKALRRAVQGKVEIRATSPRWAWVEYQLAQGGPEAGLAALDAWRGGGGFTAWKRAFDARAVT